MHADKIEDLRCSPLISESHRRGARESDLPSGRGPRPSERATTERGADCHAQLRLADSFAHPCACYNHLSSHQVYNQ